MSESGGLYVHLPFCPYICPYCDFAKWPVRASAAATYLRALDAEIGAAPEFAAKTVFLGGGTPNTYPSETIGILVERLRARFPRGRRSRSSSIPISRCAKASLPTVAPRSRDFRSACNRSSLRS